MTRTAADREALAGALDSARRFTRRIAAGLDDALARRQFDPAFSPIGWHLGHVAWQEECWALRRAGGQAPIDARLDAVYDSFDSVKRERGAQLPPLEAVERYAALVRARTLDLLAAADLETDDALLGGGTVFRFLANHERQHGEIIGIVRLLGGLVLDEPAAEMRLPAAPARRFAEIAGGRFALGADDDPDGWDNERRAHDVDVAPFRIATEPASAGQWIEFMGAGGYTDDRLWSDAGAAWRRASGAVAPLYWKRDAGGSWVRRTLLGSAPVRPEEAVSHVSWFEAEAFARFAGARLPTEAEWEWAAAWDGSRKRRFPWGNEAEAARANLALARPGPCLPGEFPEGGAASGARDMVGNVWEWTASAFAPYPGFTPQAYGGYSQPWFDGRHRVARGGSFLTQIEIARAAFRNFYEPGIRQPPLGVRLAKDA